jgi:O-methyltransferase involved in polyketide biosynthesis
MSERDWSSISPSAKAILVVRAECGLPYAREAAALLGIDVPPENSTSPEDAAGITARRRHFERRAQSIDAALLALGAERILEIASGLSFRGLTFAERANVHYLDTDLPELAARKADLVAKLHPAPLAGTLHVRPLNALDGAAFEAAARELPPGPIAVVGEGLLVYLDPTEKARLAAHVRSVLLARGGAWITGDVYVRTPVHPAAPRPYRDPRARAFVEQHRIDENKFASFDAAASFFAEQGFLVANQASRAENDPWGVRETWVLLPA